MWKDRLWLMSEQKRGRPRGWSPKTGWKRQDLLDHHRTLSRIDARAAFEGFCCAQVERVERTLQRRYSRDYDGFTNGREGPGNRCWIMPQNDHWNRTRELSKTIVLIKH